MSIGSACTLPSSGPSLEQHPIRPTQVVERARLVSLRSRVEDDHIGRRVAAQPQAVES
jgi:hypothetical protein